MTLEIRVSDSVSIFDRIGDALVRLYRQVVAVFSDQDEEETTEVVPEADPDRGPPDLGVAVGENIATGEALS